MVLKDPYNRTVTNLRISLTQRCNLRCIYCHAEGEVSPEEQMSAEDIAELMQVGAQFGIRSIKFTGGEPLLRRDLVDIIRSVPPGVESSLTTNGTLLAEMAADLKEAGLARVNVSLDTLRPDRYREITGKDRLADVLKGIDAAIEAGLTPVKLNMVLLDGINEDELDDFMAFVRSKRDVILQVIELMEFNECKFHGDVDGVEQDLNDRAKRVVTRRMHHRKKYCLDGAEVEVVRPLHNTEFCAFCNRLRVTSDGKLKPCLLRSDNLIDIRGKHGKELEDAFREAVGRRKPFFT
ncbi:GTP 3',8-cyclase MoaA [Methanoculleus horonobensis]|uniref:GTP 3',8-cyclase MoaA n=1 Tax=Methanoculleus horonobensis TaxID=528314 RepID=UPI00082D4D2E|nr:GTP 3',8-cyclase MoaA [Methanoculleus horonobensis]